MVGPSEGRALGRPDRAGPDLRRGPRLPGPCALSGHRFTVGIDVRGSQLFAQVLDAKFAPHPGEVVASHRVVRVELDDDAVFEMLDRTSCLSGKSGYLRVDLGWRRNSK